MAEGDLLIGIGNTLRGDDGVGRQLAQWAEGRWPALQVLGVQQLTPELSIPLAAARRVLFVDAWQGASPTAVDPLRAGPAAAGPAVEAPDDQGSGSTGPRLIGLRAIPAAGQALPEAGAFSHRLDPAGLLAITALLQGQVPPAWLLLVPAFHFGHRDGLSADGRAGLPQAQALLRRWIEAPAQEPERAVRTGRPTPASSRHA